MAKLNRKDATKRLAALESERASFLNQWRELSTFFLPRNGRFLTTDRNKGDRRHNAIIDRTGTGALRTLGAGMLAGMTSPARPWIRFETTDKDLLKSDAVKSWLDIASKTVLAIFARGNTYRALHHMDIELGLFGTAGSVMLDDFKDVVRHYTLTAGEYSIAQNWRGEICTLARKFEKTVGEVTKEFGRNNVSTTVRNLFDRGTLDAWVPLVQLIEPREDRDPTKRDNLNMRFSSMYYEEGGNGDEVLRESGYKDFPAAISRWDVTGGDIYGNSPGMEALGDVKQLQQEQLRKGQAIDFKTRPPLYLPQDMKTKEVSTMPGGISYGSASDGRAGTRNLFDVDLDLSHLLEDIQDVRGRINGAFYADLFLMLANGQNTAMTATEVAERHEEKMLMLGPVVERQTDETLNPLVSTTFHRALAGGLLPPVPPELHNVELQVVYISILAQAQRAIGANNIDRFVATLGHLASIKPNVIDRLDEDAWVDIYSDTLGVEPGLIVPARTAALVRKARADAQAKAQQAQMGNVQADTAQKLANAPTQGGGSNALTDLMNQFQGYGSPSPEMLPQG